MTATLPAEMAALVKRANEVLDGVTPGPWVHDPFSGWIMHGNMQVGQGRGFGWLTGHGSDGPRLSSEEAVKIIRVNGRFMAMARTIVPELLDAIEALSTALIAARREGIEAAVERLLERGHDEDSAEVLAIRALDQPTGG